MPVVAARIDQKLIHGQVSLAWAPFLDVRELIVADNFCLESEILMDILSVSIQDPVEKVTYTSPALLSECLSDGQRKKTKTMVLFRDVAGAAEALAEGVCLESLNLGNLYYKPGPEILRLTDNFFVSREDFQILADLAQSGLPIYLQSLPTTPLTPFIPSRYPWTR